MSEPPETPDPIEGLWVQPADVQAAWPDALLDEDALVRLIKAAQDVLEAYAPRLADGVAVPDRYKEALILHVREIWRAGERDGDTIGVGEYVVRAKDLTPTVKQLLRPRRGVGVLR